MQLFLWAEDSADDLRAELAQAFPGSAPAGLPPGFLGADFCVSAAARLPLLAFARQWLPDARTVAGNSIGALASTVAEAVIGILPDDQPWALHVLPRYGVRDTHRIGARAWHSAAGRGWPDLATGSTWAPQIQTSAGRQRARLIYAGVSELLQRRRRHLLRHLRPAPAPFTPQDSLAQLILTAPDAAFLSVAVAPLPFAQHHVLSPFPGGEVPIAADKSAPCRAFAKLVEAELRFGQSIQPGETCVDLGAAPGSWTWVAAQRGAQVTAVDRSPLREDLLRHPRVKFLPGDAFRFAPPRPVNWLLCDVIAAPERTAGLLLEWLRRCWCRKFIVTLKTGEARCADALVCLKQELPALTRECHLLRLCANKKELCAYGSIAG